MKHLLISVLVLMTSLFAVASRPVERVILLTIDGLHWEAPQRLQMPSFNRLVRQGTYIRQSYMLLPHHPTVGDYSTFNSCSFPNPILHEGTIFLKPSNMMIQEVFSPDRQTAFVVNTVAYKSVGRGFSTLIMDDNLTDAEVMDYSINILKNQHPVFMRIHLQRSGQRGFDISQASSGSLGYGNIFASNSSYTEAIENADVQLGRLEEYLRQSGQWDSTVLIITSDHGQSKIGWHPLFEEDSWKTPLLFVGTGIARNRVLPYFEHTDIAPTIAGLLGKEKPNSDGGSGEFIKAIFEEGDAEIYKPTGYIRTINQQIKEYNYLRAEMILASRENSYLLNAVALLENSAGGEPFYHQDRITAWSEAGTTSHLIDVNREVLKKMKLQLAKR